MSYRRPANSSRPGSRRSGRLLEVPLLFAGSTTVFVILFPMAARSEHPWLRWPVIGGYVAVLLLLFWVLRGWGRFVATLLTLLEVIVWGWIPERFRPPLVLGSPVFFLAAWAVDFWLARRASAPATSSKL